MTMILRKGFRFQPAYMVSHLISTPASVYLYSPALHIGSLTFSSRIWTQGLNFEEHCPPLEFLPFNTYVHYTPVFEQAVLALNW